MNMSFFKNFSFNWRLHLLPILVWLSSVAIVVGLFTRRSQHFVVFGITQGQQHQVAVTSDGRVKNINVRLFDTVTAGQTVAIVNTVMENEDSWALLQARTDTITAEIEHLNAQLAPAEDTFHAEQADREAQRISNARRFYADVENANLDVLRLKAQIASDTIRLDNLAWNVNITSDLLEKQAVTSSELKISQGEYDALAKQVEENELLLVEANKVLEQAKQRQQDFLKQEPNNLSVDRVLDVIQKAITIQKQRMDEVLIQIESLNSRESYELKAPFDGVVSNILRKEAEVVLAGDPILTISGNEIIDIIGYATSDQMNQLYEGMQVELIKSSDLTTTQIERSEITYVGPVIEQIPERLWRNPNVPQWGRPFLVKAPSQMNLKIDEVIGIRKL